MKKKRYSLGTGKKGTVDNYMRTPSEVLADTSLNTAKALHAGETNGFANVLDMIGKFTTASSGNIASSGVSSGLFGGDKAALGGTVDGGIEVEGGEVAETTTGDFLDFQGASHEQGGIDVDLPGGTNIFSKRIKVDGMTMAERKKKRNARLKKAQRLLDSNPSDNLIFKSYEKTASNMKNEEEADLAVQEMVDMFFGKKEGKQQAAFGDGLLSNLFKKKDPRFNDFEIGQSDNANNDTGLSDTNIEGLDDFTYNDTTIEKEPSAGSDFLSTLFSDSKSNMTAGDGIGLLGDLVSTFAPLRNTLQNRATDTPNINAFKDFGKDALAANEQAQGMAESRADNANKKVLLGKNAAKRRGRNSARGVNASRALDLASEMQANNAQLDVQDRLTRQLMNLLSQKSGLENQQDRQVMAGEQARDLADRQDKDNFATQRGRDLSTLGTGVQQIGKDINQIKSREIVNTLLDQLSKHGITLDDDYKLTDK